MLLGGMRHLSGRVCVLVWMADCFLLICGIPDDACIRVLRKARLKYPWTSLLSLLHQIPDIAAVSQSQFACRMSIDSFRCLRGLGIAGSSNKVGQVVLSRLASDSILWPHLYSAHYIDTCQMRPPLRLPRMSRSSRSRQSSGTQSLISIDNTHLKSYNATAIGSERRPRRTTSPMSRGTMDGIGHPSPTPTY
jgi:hypothetical protein